MTRKQILVAVALLLFGALPAAARDANDLTVVRGKVGQDLDEAIQRATKGGFWGAVLVAKQGKVLLAKGYGFRDYGSTPNTPHTLFEIASTSKPFTAAAILKLEQDGKLKTTDSLKTFFPNIPADKHGIQVLHLLQHTSGLSNRIGVPYHSTLSRKDYIAHLFKTPREHEPSTHFAYNNAGYAILAAIVEVASGERFETYCKKHLFAPAGMQETGFIQDKVLRKSGRAAARLGAGKAGISAVDWHWGWGYRGMGGVVTTVLDLLAWDRALRTDKVLNEKARDRYYAEGLSSYACGWRVGTTPTGGTSVSHSGSVQGFRCMYTRLLEDDVVIAVCTNDGGDPTLVAKLAQEAVVTPPRVTARLDISPYAVKQYRSERLRDVRWSAARDADAVTLRLLDAKQHAAAVVRMPRSLTAGVISTLQRSIAIRLRDDAGKPAAMEAGVVLNPYPAGRSVELKGKLSVRVTPEYSRTDKRVTFWLHDAGIGAYGFSGLIVKMNVKAAEKLLDLLKKAR